MPTPSRVLLIALLACLAGAAAAADAPNADFAAAVAHSRQAAEALESYTVEATLHVSSGLTGMGAAMTMDVTASAAAVWPDRLASSQEGTGFAVNLGTGAGGAWLHISQLGTCYQGPPAKLVRDLDASATFELTHESIYNFYSGVSSYVLGAEPAAVGETGKETLTIAGREIPCLVFTLPGEPGEPAEGKPLRGEGKAWYDPASGLVLKAAESLQVLQNGQSITQDIETVVTAFSIGQPVPAERFAYTAPAGVRTVAELDLVTNPDAMTGQSAPDITFTRFDGTTSKVSDHRGKVLFLNFWATWCGPCRMEMPHIQTLYAEMAGREDVAFIGASSEDKATVEAFLKKNAQYTFPIVSVGQADVAGPYKTSSIPSIFVIDGEGVIRAHLVGAQSEAQMRKALAKAGIGG